VSWGGGSRERLKKPASLARGKLKMPPKKQCALNKGNAR